MAPSIIPPVRSLPLIRENLIYTQTRLSAGTLTGKLASPFVDLLSDWGKVFAQELQLHDARVTAGAQIDVIDEQIDILVDRLSGVLLVRTGQDRAHPMYRHYFKTGRPSDVKRPVLGRELETVKAWVPSLVASMDTELKALGQELDKQVQAGEKAEAAWREASEKMAAFRMLDERKAFLDKVNRVRQAAYNELQQIRFSPQGRGLPPDFASGFFQRRSEVSPKLEALKEALAERERDVAELKVKIAAMEAEQSAAAQARVASERLEKEAQLREEEADLAALQARVNALKTELGR